MSKITSVKQVGLLGVGRRVGYLAELLARRSDDRVKVTAVYDPDEYAVRRAHTLFGESIKVYDSPEELFADPSLEWIMVGSLNCQHSEHAVAAMRSGKHVFCEKPLATNLDDCLRVREAIDETGRTFSFGLVLRYSPHYQKIQELVSGGAIGELISFEFNETLAFNHGGYIFGNWRRKRELAGTHLLEKCCHDLDLANWITGSRPSKVASFGGRNFFVTENEYHIARIGNDQEGRPAYMTYEDPHRTNPFTGGATILDNQVVIFEYENGVRSMFHTNCNAGILERRFYLCGTEGALRADAYTGLIEMHRIGHKTQVEQIQTSSRSGHAGGDEVLIDGLIGTMVDGKKPLASVYDGINACVAALGADRSVDTGTIIDLSSDWELVGKPLSESVAY